MKYKLVLVLMLAFFAAAFIFQNATEIDVHFLAWSVRMSQVLLMAIVFGCGFLLGLFSYVLLRRGRNSARREEPPEKRPSDSPVGVVSTDEDLPETEK